LCKKKTLKLNHEYNNVNRKAIKVVWWVYLGNIVEGTAEHCPKISNS
jgi:hypothetical protein